MYHRPHLDPDFVLSVLLPHTAEILAPGGYVFQQIHNIIADVPPKNILAMFDAVREFR